MTHHSIHAPHARFLRLGDDPGRRRDVFDGDAERLEQVMSCACVRPGCAADDDLAQFVDVGPVESAVLECRHEIAGLEAGLVLAVDDDRLAAADRDGVDLGLGEEVRADDVEVRALREPVAARAPARGCWSR